MNSTIHTADRATHLRVVALALIAAIAVTGFAISVRLSGGGIQPNMNAGVMRAQLPVSQPTAASLSANRRI